MFTGIITKTLRVVAVQKHGSGLMVRFDRPKGITLKRGESISLDGVCSTVCALKEGFIEVEYMPATLMATTMRSLTRGQQVNFEPSLRVGDPLSGHFVQGHVDVCGEVCAVEESEKFRSLTIRVPADAAKYIARKGSVAVQGVSLTVQHIQKNTFTVSLIPLTLKETNLGFLKQRDLVNIETDLLARYLARLRRK